jgi:4-amino-4-deoxy-L-arabinose transferase-like glycosyltransferase
MDRRLGCALAALLLLAAGIRVRWFTGLKVGDDVVYSTITADRLSGTLHFGNVQQTRSGFLLALLASYALLGPGEVPLVLYNLLCSVALVAAVFFLARRLFGDPAAPFAGAVAAALPNLSTYATECHTDTPVALWLTLCLLCLHAAETSARPRALLCLAGLLLGWAWLHKEHAVFLLPFLAGHWLATRRSWTWYVPMAVPFAGVLAAELAGFAVLSDNPLKRAELIRYWHSGQYMAEQYPTTGAVLHRLFLDLPLRLLAPWNGLAFPLGLAAAAVLLARRAPGARWTAGWFAALYLGYSFWPSGLFPFRPGFSLYFWTLPVLFAPLAVLAGAGLARLRRAVALPALLLLTALHLQAIHGVWLHDRRFADGAREAHAWIERERPARVIAADKTVETLDFFDGHDRRRQYFRFQDPEPATNAAIVVDRFWTEPGRWWSRPVREEALHPPPSWRKVHESGRLIVYRN